MEINEIEKMFADQAQSTPEALHKIQFVEYMQKEFELINFDKTEFGQTMMSCLLQFYDLNKGDRGKMLLFVNMLKRIVERNPLAILQEDEITEVDVAGTKMKKHPRYEWLEVMPDGRYLDVHGIGFVNPDGVKWYGANGQYRSAIEVTLPYFPEEKIIYVESDMENTRKL